MRKKEARLRTGHMRALYSMSHVQGSPSIKARRRFNSATWNDRLGYLLWYPSRRGTHAAHLTEIEDLLSERKHGSAIDGHNMVVWAWYACYFLGAEKLLGIVWDGATFRETGSRVGSRRGWRVRGR